MGWQRLDRIASVFVQPPCLHLHGADTSEMSEMAGSYDSSVIFFPLSRRRKGVARQL